MAHITQSAYSGFEAPVEDLQTRKVLVLGLPGSGKTSVCRHVAGFYEQSDDIKLHGSKVSYEIREYKGKYFGQSTKTRYTMIDTDNAPAKQVYDFLRFEKKINCAIICISCELFRRELKNELSGMLSLLYLLGISGSNILYVFTHGETYTHEAKFKFVSEFKKTFDIDTEYPRVIYGCFNNLHETNGVYSSLIATDVSKSITELREIISKYSRSINVAANIDKSEYLKKIINS